MTHRLLRCAFTLVVLAAGASIASAQAPELEKKARVILDAHCFKCHSHQAAKAKGDLMLDTRAFMLKGGFNGPALVPGDPAKSLLIKSITHEDPDL